MAEYIEREAVTAMLKRECSPRVMAYLVDELCKIPAADVRPVRRGKWGKYVGENGVTSACRCSLCGFEDNRFSVFNYCPNCGADMRPTSMSGANGEES